VAGETEVLGEIPPQRHFVHHKCHLTRPGIEPEPPRWDNISTYVKLQSPNSTSDQRDSPVLILTGPQMAGRASVTRRGKNFSLQRLDRLLGPHLNKGYRLYLGGGVAAEGWI
jgi:hypothetical protein